MKVLIACEFSGVVRDAFTKKGHDAISCDLIETESPGAHYIGDVFDIINDGFDMMIAHPPCRYLTTTGNRHFVNNPDRWKKRLDAMLFVHALLNAKIKKICLENPKGVISSHIGKPSQYIQPYHHGHNESKMTGLWLKGLPDLSPTNEVEPEWVVAKNGDRYSKTAWYKSSSGNEENRKIRQRTFSGIANAMAEQWG